MDYIYGYLMRCELEQAKLYLERGHAKYAMPFLRNALGYANHLSGGSEVRSYIMKAINHCRNAVRLQGAY